MNCALNQMNIGAVIHLLSPNPEPNVGRRAGTGCTALTPPSPAERPRQLPQLYPITHDMFKRFPLDWRFP